MSPAAKLAAFAVVLVVVFAAAWGIGSAVGPIGADAPEVSHTDVYHRVGG